MKDSPIDSRRLLLCVLLICCAAGFGVATELSSTSGPIPPTTPPAALALPAPGPGDRCAVCGMFPAKFPKWCATVLFKDGHAEHFDGPKDLFKYLLDMAKHAQGRVERDIEAVGVTDYYEVRSIDARRAFYVIGSDVLGPMGHELVAHPTRPAAEEFVRDHQGKRIVGFDEVSAALLAGLDEGRFEAR